MNERFVNKMRIKIIGHSDLIGGAARAAYRLQRALVASGFESCMQVSLKKSDDWRVISHSGKFAELLSKIRPALDRLPTYALRTSNAFPHSPAWTGSFKASEINIASDDVVNLHWTCAGALSVEQIGRIARPVVLTLHDMWAFCGGEHYAPDEGTNRWRDGYNKQNRSLIHNGLDVDRWVWLRKKRAWKRPFHVITPSNWLADCVRQSALMSDWPVTVIPNPLDAQAFKPIPKALARQILGLPPNAKLVLFGAIGGGKDPRKGWDLLQPALTQVAKQLTNVEAVIFGQSEPRNPPMIGLPLHWLGHLHDDASLAVLYSAVDVTVVPSRQENLPQSGTEAQACGCPVVAFNITGLTDVVEHGVTGYLAEAYSSEDLAKGIAWVLANPSSQARLSAEARKRALKLWAAEVVIPQYLELFEEAIKGQTRGHLRRKNLRTSGPSEFRPVPER